MIGAGRELRQMTNRWREKKDQKRRIRSRAQGRAKGQAEVLNIFDMITAEPEDSEYRARLERYIERMREAISNNESFNEPLPLRTE